MVLGVQVGRRGTVRADLFAVCFSDRMDSCWGVRRYGFADVAEMIFMFLRSSN